jgi:hypothetical protein
VALSAVTVNVDELPAVSEAGLAVIPTVGTGLVGGVPLEEPPHPAISKESKKLGANVQKIPRMDRRRET